MDDVSFGRKANEDREEGDHQEIPDEYCQQRAHVVLRNGSASHGEKHRRSK